MRTYNNPILSGFYPDPSICKAGDDYYIVNSTFAYFPGIPVHHSRDLVHWQLIGNVLTRESQINLENARHSGGIFAPTIRYHDGLFYVVVTDSDNMGNFIVTATDPAGPWSDPYLLHVEGIDPSLFWDDDGTCYFCCARERNFLSDNQIWLQELDTKTMQLKGEEYPIWDGAMKQAKWVEAPHLYKKDGYYYLITAEGGTSYNHSVMVARSKNITGPYENYIKNPILTHKNLDKNYEITNTGHGDLIETKNGEWFMVLLATRPNGGVRNLGRETFMVPVSWEDGWPCVKNGLLELEYPVPDLKQEPEEPRIHYFSFQDKKLSPCWMQLRKGYDYSFWDNKQGICLKTGNHRFNYLCQRRYTINFETETEVELGTGEAGLMLMQGDDCYAEIAIGETIRINICIRGDKELLYEQKRTGDVEKIGITGNDRALHFFVNGELILVEERGTRISSEYSASGFTGNCIGMFVRGGEDAYSEFHYFTYQY